MNNQTFTSLMCAFRDRAKLVLTLALLAFTLAIQAQSGIFESYAIINTGGSDIFYDLQASTANPDFNGANLGSFTQCTATLRLDGGQNKTFKCPGDDITNGTIWYRVYPTGSPSGSFTPVNLPFNANLGTGCGGNDQVWEQNAENINLLANRTPGNYTLEVYTTANFTFTGGGGGSGTHFANNGGANYSATFTITGGATCPVFVTASGGTAFASYTTVNAAFTAINAGTHQGVISITIAANTTEPATPVALLRSNAPSSYSSISIKPFGNVTVNSAATPTSGRAVLEFNGADNVTIDGDDPATSGTRNLTLQVATSSSGTLAAVRYASNSTTDGATNNTIKNCVIIGSRNSVTSTQTNFGIYSGTSGTSTMSTSGQSDNNDNLTIENNEIRRAYWGIYCAATSANFMDNLIIRNNIIGSSTASDAVANRGIYFQNTQSTASAASALIEGNDIRITASSSSTSSCNGIEIANGNAGAIISKNKIHDVSHPNTGGYGAYGISITGSSNNAGITIVNNFIWDMTNDNWSSNISATSSDLPVGIRVSAGATGLKIYHNSISLNAPNTDPVTAGYSACIQLTTTGITGTDIRNNIFSNTQTGATGSKYFTFVVPSGFTFGTINNNDYFANTAINIIGWNGADRTTLAAWQTVTGQDGNSVAVAPGFTSSADLHIPNATNTVLESGGAAIGVTTDIDGDPRPNGFAPDIGADEFSGINPNLCSGTPAAGTASAMTTLICGTSGNSALSLAGFTSGTGITYQWKSSSTAGGPYTNITGATTTSYNATGITSTTYYVITTTCVASGMSATSNEVAVVVAPAVTASISPSSPTICAGDNQMLSASPSGSGESYLWSTSETSSAITVSPGTSTMYSVVVTSTSGCTGNAVVTVVVNPVPTNPMAGASDIDICEGEIINLSASADPGTVILINENFNSGAPGWSTLNNSTGGTPANAAWTIRTSPYIYSSTTFDSGDAQFYMTNSDAQGSGGTTNTRLVSPAFSTIGFTSLNLSFSHYYRDITDSGDNAFVEISTDGLNWTQVQVYTSNQGAANAFAPASIDLADYVGFPSVTLRFRYAATWDWYWAVDQVVVSGLAPIYTYNWSSMPMGFSSTDQNPTGVSPSVSTTYSVLITNAFGCSSPASVAVNVTPATIWYQDSDMDTYGNPAVSQMACTQPMGYVANSDDCDDTNGAINPTTVWYLDADMDNYYVTGSAITQCASPGTGYRYTGLIGDGDCNDSNGAINPGATEVCDGADNNCNAMIDEGVQTTFYLDADMDGYYTGSPIMACSSPGMGYVTTVIGGGDCNDSNGAINPATIWYLDADMDNYYVTGSAITQCVSPGIGYRYTGVVGDGDCNDSNAAVYPGATEVINGIDDNCNSMIDENGITYFRDMDSDGFGDPGNSVIAGMQPPGYVLDNTDCNDNNALEKPGQVWYKDTDNDGYAQTGAATITQCLRPTGYKAASELTSTTGDCNDNNAAINPEASEVCDGVDNNCNSSIDEGVLTTYYRDMDNDGFGNPSVTQMACSQPGGYVTNNTDCNDNSALEKPGQIWYKDTDGDTYAETGAATITQCLRPTGYKVASELTSTTGDCNDNNAAINPVASEVCDGVDNNCNSSIDEGVLTTYYRDMDNDGFGNPSVTQMACSQPGGYVTNNTDCNDNSALEKPGQIWYKDTDGDTYAETGAATITQCLRPTGYKVASELTSTTGDCNDNNAAINPVASEVCDGVDNNCNSSIDEGVLTTYYRDMDNDGFGNPSVTQMACSQPGGYVTNNTDCNDNNALEKPGQIWYKDTDNDGYAQTGAATITQCLRPTGYKAASELTSTTGDCNDNNAAINPAASEVCDGVDNNCNSSIDEGVLTTYYRDMDNDGFGNPSVTQMACSQPSGYVTNNTDCNDNSALEKPGQIWYKDTDGDTYAETGAATITQCLRPTGYKVASELTSTTGDCNDNNAAINPVASEVCDGVDNNCNSSIDEGVQTTYYRDMDSDGFGNPSVTQMACSQPSGYVTNNTDCNDNSALEKPGQIWYKDTDNDGYAQTGAATITQCLRPTGYKAASELTSTTGDCNDNNAAINPAASEICDGIDNNCNGSVDEPLPIGNPWSNSDVGAPGVNGSASNGCAGNASVYNVSASGFSTSSSDKLHLVYQTLCGNGEIIARVVNVTDGGWAGITLRESLAPGSKKVVLKTQLTSIIRREIRNATNGPSSMLNFNRPQHIWLRLVRNGSNFEGYTSVDGQDWNFAFTANISMAGCIYAGMFAESINVNVTTDASFDNVTVIGSNPTFGATAPVASALDGLSVSVYPNPGNGVMTLSVKGAPETNLRLEVMNALGSLIRDVELPEGAAFTYPLDLSNEAAGVYYLRLRSESGVENVQRVVIQQ